MIDIVVGLKCDSCHTQRRDTMQLYERCTSSDVAAYRRSARGPERATARHWGRIECHADGSWEIRGDDGYVQTPGTIIC